MVQFTFSDLLGKAGIDPAKTKLIRHSFSSWHFRECFNRGLVKEYTAEQRQGFSKGYDYWAVFTSDKGSLSRFYTLYKVNGSVPNTPDLMPENWPIAGSFQGTGAYFNLERLDVLKQYEGRLIIDWGKATRMWHQKGTTEKPVVAIQAEAKRQFPGYQNMILSFDQLEEVVQNSIEYELWQTALASVYAVYLIVDTKSGKQYVGSAYGKDGLLGRWRCYVETYHGGNKLMVDLISAKPEQYKHFQFSILQLLEKTATADEVIQTESLWKKKLQTIAFGMNDN